jgi:dTDP-4-dehydrorhamnose 3,5-epimerase
VNVTFHPTALPGVLICALHVFRDPRGFFAETFHERKYREGGVAGPFVQDNFSHSAQGTLRGLHYQCRHPQAKLVTAMRGAIYDVAVDIRRGSPTFGRWVGTILSRENARQLYIPAGFAHGFCVLSEEADVVYKCTDFYDPADDFGLAWNDPELAIEWPVAHPTLSKKDAALPRLRDAGERLPVFAG